VPVDRSHDQANERERLRLVALAGRSEAELGRELAGGWTVAAALAHVAFWERFAVERWKVWLRDRALPPLPPYTTDTLNDGLLHQWLAIPPKAAAREAVAAAEAIDRLIRELADEAIEAYRASLAPGQPHTLLDRSPHRREHCDHIEKVLG